MKRLALSNRAALVMSAAALIMSAGFAGGPAIARAIVSNSDKVDGLHAAKADTTPAQRKGKLVATDPATGSFKANVIPSAAKFPAKVPVGVTLTGIWAFDTQSAGTGGDYGSVIDIRVELPAEVVPVFSPSGGAVTHCPGTWSAPAAEPGYFCLYKRGGTGLDFTTFVGFMTGNYGLGYRFSGNASAANQDIFVNGTWAVTTAAFTPMKTDPAAATKR
jgi:hypothetical protein